MEDFLKRIAIRYQYLLDETEVDSDFVPLYDPNVMALFRECDTEGIPEFHGEFAENVLRACKPDTFMELVKVYSLMHGKGVWKGNAEVLLADNKCSLREVIASKEDVCRFLINAGADDRTAVETGEKVQKGQIVNTGNIRWLISLQSQYQLPNWWVESISKIRYMYPLIKAMECVQTEVRIAWFKVYYPEAFYASTAIDRVTGAKL